MLRQGLRAEFPAVFDVARRLRRPAVPAMAAALAAVGALGVSSLVAAAMRSVQSVGLYASGTFLLRSSEPVTVAGYAFAVIFAFGVARWRGAFAAVALFGVLWIEQFWLSLPGRQTFCERSATPCDLLSLAWPQLWPQLLGIALGLVALRAVRQGGRGIAALALGIGVFTLSFSIARLAFIPFLGVAPLGEAARGATNTIIGGQLVGALAAGMLLGWFGKRHVIDAVIILVYFVGPWSTQLRVPDLFYAGFHFERDWQLFIPVGYALVALIGLTVSVVVARYRATRLPTIP